MTQHAITPTRAEDYPEWYQQVIKAADLAENSPVRGCMVVKPWGYALWEGIQKTLDIHFKQLGVRNFYCPLFIPLSFIAKEAAHIEGFAKECAVVTHHRLESDGQGGLQPAGPLEEPLVIRPTSETIIGDCYSRWVQSYRDLPLLYNQWANVVRWEMRTRLFLRTSEFLWQEGHTAHATAQEANAFSRQILDVYRDFCHHTLAMPVLKGEKSASERFPGAIHTYCIEGMMQDGKALQAGTSHFLGQNFAKAFNIEFQDQQSQVQHAWTTSWGVSTRLIGGVIMTHSDDDGLVLPPKIAPSQVVILPFLRKQPEKVMAFCKSLRKMLGEISFGHGNLEVELDTRDEPGRQWTWIKKGLPIRIEVGARELEQNQVALFRRNHAHKDKTMVAIDELPTRILQELASIQENLYQKALDFQTQNTIELQDEQSFYAYFNDGDDASFKGFAKVFFAGDDKLEEKIKNDLKVTVRCLPFMASDAPEGRCVFTGQKTRQIAILGRSY